MAQFPYPLPDQREVEREERQIQDEVAANRVTPQGTRVPGEVTEEELAEAKAALEAGRWAWFTRDRVARLLAEIERLHEEIMGYQVDDGYGKGYEHGQAAVERLRR